MAAVSVPTGPPSSAIMLRNGGLATLIVLTLAGAICAAFKPHVLTTWVGFSFMAATPAQIILVLLWQTNHPPAIARLSQPRKGFLLSAATVLAACVIGPLLFYLAGAGVGPPTPMLLMFTMTTIIATMWLVPVWRCWPVSVLTSNPTALGIATLVTAYAVAFLVFNLLFNFSFLAHTPLYVVSLDPKGRLNAWVALSFLVTTVAVIVVAIAFDFWPVSTLIRSRRQPAFGLASTILILVASILLYSFFTRLVGLDPVQHLVRVAVSLIYGVFLVEIMMRHRLLDGWRQPLRGVALTAIAGVLALLMYSLYAASASVFAQRAVPAGPPAYELEIWVANAMLGITFPLMIVVAEFFELWPLHRPPPSPHHRARSD
jgi:hypothetical protein